MKEIRFSLIAGISLILCLAATRSSSQVQFSIVLAAFDSNGDRDTLIFGYNPSATYCEDPAFGEFEGPPPPPTFDMAWISPRAGFDPCFPGAGRGTCCGPGMDIRGANGGSTEVDTFAIRINYKLDQKTNPITLSWPNLNPYFGGSVQLVDRDDGGTLVNVDMKSSTTVVLHNNNTNVFQLRLFIIAHPFATLPPPPQPVPSLNDPGLSILGLMLVAFAIHSLRKPERSI